MKPRRKSGSCLVELRIRRCSSASYLLILAGDLRHMHTSRLESLLDTSRLKQNISLAGAASRSSHLSE